MQFPLKCRCGHRCNPPSFTGFIPFDSIQLYEVNIRNLHFLGNKLLFQLNNCTSIPLELLNFLISVCEDVPIRLEQFFRDDSSSQRGI